MYFTEKEIERGWGGVGGGDCMFMCVDECGLGGEEAEDSCVVERYSYQVCPES